MNAVPGIAALFPQKGLPAVNADDGIKALV
jgi:hypothetical protein